MGYDDAFLGDNLVVPIPGVAPDLEPDLVQVGGTAIIDYTHFSLVMSRSRRLARWVAWNIDGARFEFADSISRDGVDFRPDPRVPLSAQTLDAVYASNSLDRGHLARRSDLLWGPLAEARRANGDSFFFTNITPQRANFNQSGAAGIWGELEDALLESTKADRQRVCVIAGPVLAGDDPEYRGTLLPRAFYKVIVYATDDALTVQAFLLTQNLDNLERVAALDDFDVYLISLDDLADRARIVFDPVLLGAQSRPRTSATAQTPRQLRSVTDVEW